MCSFILFHFREIRKIVFFFAKNSRKWPKNSSKNEAADHQRNFAGRGFIGQAWYCWTGLLDVFGPFGYRTENQNFSSASPVHLWFFSNFLKGLNFLFLFFFLLSDSFLTFIIFVLLSFFSFRILFYPTSNIAHVSEFPKAAYSTSFLVNSPCHTTGNWTTTPGHKKWQRKFPGTPLHGGDLCGIFGTLLGARFWPEFRQLFFRPKLP